MEEIEDQVLHTESSTLPKKPMSAKGRLLKDLSFLTSSSHYNSTSYDNDDIDDTSLAMCNLGKACGTCHANFRRLLTSQLANEVSGWSGQYIKNCN